MNDTSIQYCSIANLLDRPRDRSYLIATAKQSTTDWAGWLGKVADWQQYLCQREEQRWALHHPNAEEFSVILFALWSLGKTVCLPGNTQAAVVAELATTVDAFIGDFSGLVNTPTPPYAPISDSDIDTSLLATRLDTEAPLLELYTSGSSGEPQCMAKSIRQLSSEIDHHHTLWSHRHPDAQILSTVSHQHIYGLLFRVLWPLAEGWCMSTSNCEYWEELQQQALPDRTLLLISSPTHLSRLPVDIASQPFVKNLTAIYSSGAPLQQVHSLQAQQQLSCDVREIYGSTETGGIAWRQQQEQATPWQPLPGVDIQLNPDNQCLSVRSTHLPDPTQWYNTSDRIKLNANGCFELAGRIDRIVKVEGKRLSLDDMEQRLSQHPGISQVRLLLLEGRRSEVAAVVVLSANKTHSPSTADKRTLAQTFRQYLSGYFERPLLPRRWRYVSALPINTQGKIQNRELMNLFTAKAEQECELPKNQALKTESSSRAFQSLQLPDELSRQVGDNTLMLSLEIPADLIYFDGHFDQHPILPGVIQLHWAQHYARQSFPLRGEFLCMEVVKFQKIIAPRAQVTLTLNFKPQTNKVLFQYHSGQGNHASGRLVYGR